ncbi:MAG: ABC transporter substrate-binding protein [Halobacteriovoraceae bacterium]|jgi:peptide/nickel transport system substrate-binding protein|nr:ABC transporter substrate-binding protein [Halobacteriovoraceae bacterium]MBT5094180.1 ABC transporter substrate-binding protein [Halobacteriovoraceae bacterium]
MKVLLLICFFWISSSYGNTLRVAISSSPNNLNPFFSTDANSQNINRLLHISLTDFNQKMQFSCHLCLSYSERIVKGKHHLRFKLRQDVTFWDGSPVSAEDVKRSWFHISKNPKIKSVFRFSFESIEKVIVHGRFDIELIYKNFSLENLSNLALLKIVKINESIADVSLKDIIGAGSYRLGAHSVLGVRLEPRQKELPLLDFKVVKDETTLALKLINGEIDLSIANISPRKLNWLKESKKGGLAFWETPSATYRYIGINHRHWPLSELSFRKALALLIPRLDIIKYKLRDTGVLANSLFSKAFADMYQYYPIDTYDPEKAQLILKSAGFSKNSAGYFQKEGKLVELDWKVSSNKASLELVNTMVDFLKKNGVKVNITTQEWGTFMRNFKQGNYDLVIGRWIGFTDASMLKYVFHSKSLPPKGGNRGHFINSEFDRFIDRATSEVNSNRRINYYKEAVKIANKQYAYLHLWHPHIIWITRNCIKNLTLEPNGSFYPLKKLKNDCK